MIETLRLEELDPTRVKKWLRAKALVADATEKQHALLKDLKCLRSGCDRPRARATEPGRMASDPLCHPCKQRHYRRKEREEDELKKGGEARMVAANAVPSPRLPVVTADAGGPHVVREPGKGRKSAPRTEKGKRRAKR